MRAALRQNRPMAAPDDGFVLDVSSLSAVLDLLPAATSVWDRGMRNVYASSLHESWFGFSPAAMRGRLVDDIIGAEAAHVRRPLYEAVLGGHAGRYEGSITTPAGRRRVETRLAPYRDAEGRVVAIVALVTDITEAHEAQRGLRAQGERLRLLYEQTPALLLSIDAAGQVLAVTDRCLAALGAERADVLGRAFVDFLTDESRRRLETLGLPVLFRDGRLDRWAFVLRCPDGLERNVLLSAIVEQGGAGQPLRALATLDDVTGELTRAAELWREHELRMQVERHARELDELLAERGTMIDVLAHEVRQPLNNASAALQSAAVLLAHKGDADTSARLARAQAVLGEVLAGVDNTLAAATLLARAGPPALADADIDTLLAVVIGDLPPAARPRVHIERLTPTRTAVLDLGLVRLALRNLLANALAWSPADAPVTVRLSDSDEPLALLIDVVDRGPGIAPEVLPRVFDRGVRAGARGGHGLGLFIARRAMELQGGQASVLATGPAGTTMRLALAQSG